MTHRRTRNAHHRFREIKPTKAVLAAPSLQTVRHIQAVPPNGGSLNCRAIPSRLGRDLVKNIEACRQRHRKPLRPQARTLDRDVRPDRGVFRIQLEPVLKTGVGIGKDGFGRALRLAHAAIDAFFGVNHEHVLALVEAVQRTNFDAIHVFDLMQYSVTTNVIPLTPVARDGLADKTRPASGSRRYAQPLREIVR
jgi:hypothetical protein